MISDTELNYIDEIFSRTQGKWENFNILGKIYFKNLYSRILKEYEEALPVIKFWANLKLTTQEIDSLK